MSKEKTSITPEISPENNENNNENTPSLKENSYSTKSEKQQSQDNHQSILPTFVTVLSRFAFGLSVLAFISNLYLSNYYKLNPLGCSWQDQLDDNNNNTDNKDIIHLLAFGDPQIRAPLPDSSYRTRLDLWGNDRYLSHIYQQLMKGLSPSHVAVLGDLISSQWITDEEFYDRADRFNNIIFKKDIFSSKQKQLSKEEQVVQFFNVCGNHDVGYAGEMSIERVSRYEKRYGKVNFKVDYYHHPPSDKKTKGAATTAAYRIVVLNSLAIDGPIWEDQYQQDTLDFLKSLKENPFNDGPTILLTHVPLHKPNGTCVDSPYFEYYPKVNKGGVREQNFLSEESSKLVLNSVFNEKYGGVILTGHDHEGCVVKYKKKTIQQDEEQEDDNNNGTIWKMVEVPKSNEIVKMVSTSPTIIEATVRSMMGEYGGNAGLLSARYNSTSDEWVFSYSLCPFVIQHFWWFTQVITILSSILIGAYFILNSCI